MATMDLEHAGDAGAAAFPLLGKLVPAVVHTPLTGSTQDDLAELWRNGAPAWTAMVADHQWAGRGRVGRTWYSRPGQSLLLSLIIEIPASAAAHVGWIPLAASLAAREAVERLTRAPIQVSWPNDLVVGSPARKLGGILGEVCARTEAGVVTVLGWGLNLAIPAEELPTPTSTSLSAAGLSVPGRDELMAAYVAGLRRRLDALTESGDPEGAGLVGEINAVTETLREGITVGRPLLPPVSGTGRRITADGSIEIETDEGLVTVTSGEVSLLGMTPQKGAR